MAKFSEMSGAARLLVLLVVAALVGAVVYYMFLNNITAGIEIRRYTATPGVNLDFYSEVPFAIDMDGPYYSVLGFFQRVSELERIVNIDNLQMSNTKTTGPAKVKGTYPYAPGETVVTDGQDKLQPGSHVEVRGPAGTSVQKTDQPAIAGQ